jgi:hypothetical protein
MRQFGTYLPDKVGGIGSSLRYDKDGQTLGLINPNKLVMEEEMDVNIAGRLKLRVDQCIIGAYCKFLLLYLSLLLFLYLVHRVGG